MEEGRGCGFSLSAGDETLILGIVALREPAAKEDRFRVPSSFGLASMTFGSLCESAAELVSDLVVATLLRLALID
jgi:hypothetical protein